MYVSMQYVHTYVHMYTYCTVSMLYIDVLYIELMTVLAAYVEPLKSELFDLHMYKLLRHITHVFTVQSIDWDFFWVFFTRFLMQMGVGTALG